jgi:hypothetical protein
MKRDPKRAKNPEVRKLLRVLVAGGVAMAGAAAPLVAVADEKAPPDQAERSGQAEPGRASNDQVGKATDPAAGEKQPSKKEASKKETRKKGAGDDGGGVAGW